MFFVLVNDSGLADCGRGNFLFADDSPTDVVRMFTAESAMDVTVIEQTQNDSRSSAAGSVCVHHNYNYSYIQDELDFVDAYHHDHAN